MLLIHFTTVSRASSSGRKPPASKPGQPDRQSLVSAKECDNPPRRPRYYPGNVRDRATTQSSCFHTLRPQRTVGTRPTRSRNGSKPIFPDQPALGTDRSQFSRTNPLSERIEAIFPGPTSLSNGSKPSCPADRPVRDLGSKPIPSNRRVRPNKPFDRVNLASPDFPAVSLESRSAIDPHPRLENAS